MPQWTKSLAREWHTIVLVACGPALLAVFACHEPAATSPPSDDGAPSQTVSNGPVATGERAVTPIRIPIEDNESERWLFVLKVREGEAGAWATGSFDAKRNKLDIHTRGAQAFAIDVSRIPINWDELVVIGIDGVNSELRKRDYSVLQFALDDHNQWTVVEP